MLCLVVGLLLFFELFFQRLHSPHRRGHDSDGALRKTEPIGFLSQVLPEALCSLLNDSIGVILTV